MFLLYSLFQTVHLRCKSLLSAIIIIIIIIIIITCVSICVGNIECNETASLRQICTNWRQVKFDRGSQ